MLENLEQKNTDEDKYNKFVAEVKKGVGVKYKNITELASMMSHAYQNLNNMIIGKKPLADIVIYKWCELFQYKPGYFFGRDPYLLSYSKDNLSSAKQKEVMDLFMKKVNEHHEFIVTLQETLKRN